MKDQEWQTGELIRSVDKPTGLRQELEDRLDRKLKIVEVKGVTPENVHEIEESFKVMQPRTRDFDLKLKEYFQFLSCEMWKVLEANEGKGIGYPLAVYDGEVKSLDELKEKVIQMAKKRGNAVKDRGRGHYGQIGDWFWDTSDVEDLGEENRQLGIIISLAVKYFDIDVNEYHRRVNLGQDK